MRFKVKGLEDYEVQAISFPLEEAPEGSTEDTHILISVLILPSDATDEKTRIKGILSKLQSKIEEKVGSKLLKVIVKPK